MLDRLLEITYKTTGGEGFLKLKYDHPEFGETLAKVEQTLADSKATDIVYVLREEKLGDFD